MSCESTHLDNLKDINIHKDLQSLLYGYGMQNHSISLPPEKGSSTPLPQKPTESFYKV